MDIPVKDREGGKQQETNQVFKPLDVSIKINHRINLFNLSDIKKKIDHLSLPEI
jgi:hypothetical protein